MDKAYNHKNVEDNIYALWEKNGYFAPEIHPKGKPYAIVLPPPNANGDLHFGHAMFTVEDILIRYHRMRGFAALWLPGTDHAGFETQYVFEKNLQAQGRSRFDYSNEELYQMIWDFVKASGGRIQNQLRKLGFSLDWSREKFTLDPDIVALVHQAFKKMYDEGYIYRGQRLVNYCTRDGTSFSDLEVVYEERNSLLYYIKYGPLVLATTRPETKFGDTAVAVHPKDKRYKQYIGKTISIETVLGPAEIMVIADTYVDPEFGTGVVKITPAHDFADFEVAQRHGLPLKQVIGFDGKMNDHAGKFSGMYAKKAREAIVEEMQKKGLIEKIDQDYTHRVALCYKCKTILEPLPKEQWFVKVEKLRDQAITAVKKGEIRIVPKNFETHYFQWLENLRDWNISRQTVWGIQIPAWHCNDCSERKTQNEKRKITTQNSKVDSNEAIKQSSNYGWIVTGGLKPKQCPVCGSTKLEQDADTFDTWFSSGQWPFVTLKTTRPGDFEKFYPTAVLETAYDILRAWVSRMVMLGLYTTGKPPFRDVLFHGIVNDPLGKKMSKSKGNVVNPLELVETYGADAVRFALIYGNATGQDQSLSYPKLEAARRFTNKVWNIGRFIEMKRLGKQAPVHSLKKLHMFAISKEDKVWIKKVDDLVAQVSAQIEKYQFNYATEALYEFVWHEFADTYIEDVKNRMDENASLVLLSLYVTLLKLLHPFMPFVTEAIYQTLFTPKTPLIIESWPKEE
ncbi:MAG TPA: valine--tRNA ligase [Patescibacteria group bacterium]|nr:valine--tRNA ligase [Patescibacteria group bacterium]